MPASGKTSGWRARPLPTANWPRPPGRRGCCPGSSRSRGGWDTPAGTRGGAVSGGERQRLALARALLAGPDLLILDEPTAHLDPETRAALTADLLDVTKGRATLLITHELRGLDQVDQVAVLEAGRIADRGTHDELLRECPLYRQMWDAEQALTAAV
jgi:ATP-binding cassette, subfamily C, bacterial CydC